MQERSQVWSRAFEPIEREPSWAWAARSIDYSRVENYDTSYKGPFDPGLMPFWKQPLECMRDRDEREIVILKASRAGFSENLVLTDLRYTIAIEPEPTLYLTASMDLALGFLDRRVKRGMGLAHVLRDGMKNARIVKQDVQFRGMDFRATWSTSDTATKQDGWARIYCDEVSLWSEFTLDMVRRRCAAYPWHHIVYGGSMDPTRRGDPEEDPMWKLWQESDQRHWMMHDPITGNLFAWRFDGIKWPETCKDGDVWDLAKVDETAYYTTPDGTRIDNTDRMHVTRSGAWHATNPAGRRPGFRVTAAMVPFVDCSFGQLAVAFLSAKHRIDVTASRHDRKRNTLRTYFAEYWGEIYREEQVAAQDETLASREAPYEYGGIWCPTGYDHGIMMTVDVQKRSLWWLARVWSINQKTGDVQSALLEFGNCATVLDCDAKAGEIKPALLGVDIGYRDRAAEVAEWCAEYTPQHDPRQSTAFALFGNSKMTATILDYQIRDAMEGKAAARRKLYVEYAWLPDVFRSWLVDSLNGEHATPWFIPAKWPDARWRAEYARQVTSTHREGDEWIAPRHGQDHGFDLECMQFVLARIDGLVK